MPPAFSQELEADTQPSNNRKPASPADGSNCIPATSAPGWEWLGPVSTANTTIQEPPAWLGGSDVHLIVQQKVAAVRDGFKIRVQSKINDPLNTTPSGREKFERMLWVVMIVGGDNAPATDGSLASPAHAIPIIRSIPSTSDDIEYTRSAQVWLGYLDVVMALSNVFLYYYQIPPRVSVTFAEIARSINSSPFTRYMGSRGRFRQELAFGPVMGLLRWWATTTPALMMEYRTAISMKNEDAVSRESLRVELRNVLGIDGNEGKSLELAMTKGFEEVAAYRRMMHMVVADSFEMLVDESRAGGVM